jgi:hypothetical protein
MTKLAKSDIWVKLSRTPSATDRSKKMNPQFFRRQTAIKKVGPIRRSQSIGITPQR